MNRIVFDFDGTLLDSRYRHVAVMRACLEEAGYTEISLDAYLEYKADGNSSFDYLTNILGLSEDGARSISESWVSRIENKNYLLLDKLYEDAIPVLESLTKDNELFLLSARQSETELLAQAKRFGIDKFFEEIICVSPKNAVQEKANVLADIKADLMVGDTEVDLKAAEVAGVKARILNRGFRSKKYWEKIKVKSIRDLIEFKPMYGTISGHELMDK